MATTIYVNSPVGPGGKMAGLSEEEFIPLAVSIYKGLKVRRVDRFNLANKEVVDSKGQPVDLTYEAGSNYADDSAFEKVDEDEIKNSAKQTVIELQAPVARLRQRRDNVDEEELLAADEPESITSGVLADDEVHMWIKCLEANPSRERDDDGGAAGGGGAAAGTAGHVGVMVQRATFADQGDMEPQAGDWLAVTGYNVQKWCTVKIVHVKRHASKGDFKYRVEFSVDGSFDELQLLPKQYGLGLRVEQWAKKEAKTRLGWMFLRPTTEVGGNILRDAASIFEAKGY